MAEKVFIFVVSVWSFAILSAALQANIHEYMTPSEIFDFFGTDENNVPSYEIASVRTSDLRGKRSPSQKHQSITFTIQAGESVSLEFTQTDGFLVNENVPVWIAETDPKFHQKIKYSMHLNAMSAVGNFTLYHALTTNSAIVIYELPSGETMVQGKILGKYPVKTFLSPWKKVIAKRFIDDPQLMEDTTFFAIFEPDAPSEIVKRSTLVQPPFNLRREKRERRNKGLMPKTIYPEFLIALDYNFRRDHSLTEVLQYVVSFWNAVDMFFAKLSEPRVRLNIAGIIIANDDLATPYLATKSGSDEPIRFCSDIITKIEQNFNRERVRFPGKNYDTIIGMTTKNLYAFESKDSEKLMSILGCSVLGAGCASQDILSRAIIRSDVHKYGVTDTMAHEIAHLYGVLHDGIAGKTDSCKEDDGYIMSAKLKNCSPLRFEWSNCSIAYFKNYFKSKESQCVDNRPRSIQPDSYKLWRKK